MTETITFGQNTLFWPKQALLANYLQSLLANLFWPNTETGMEKRNIFGRLIVRNCLPEGHRNVNRSTVYPQIWGILFDPPPRFDRTSYVEAPSKSKAVQSVRPFLPPSVVRVLPPPPVLPLFLSGGGGGGRNHAPRARVRTSRPSPACCSRIAMHPEFANGLCARGRFGERAVTTFSYYLVTSRIAVKISPLYLKCFLDPPCAALRRSPDFFLFSATWV